MESELVKKLLSLGDAGEDTVLVTITRTTGSTPRSPGAKMLVLKDGRVYGTIGGGCGEAEVKREALSVLDANVSKKYYLDMSNDVASGEGMVCGGKMEVFLDYIGNGDNESRRVITAYLNSLQKNENPLLVTITGIDEDNKQLLGRKMVFLPANSEIGDLGHMEITEQARILADQYRAAREPGVVAFPAGVRQNINEKLELLFEPGILAPLILILGGGHIAVPLVKMSSILGYNTIVVDDRPSFANKILFPDAKQVICAGFGEYLKSLKAGAETFIVIVTRGHMHDLECLREVINQPAAYIGMIGSRRKVKMVMAQLEKEGISCERLNEVYSPIGLDIGAETPEEIALSILAEIVGVRRGGKLMKRDRPGLKTPFGLNIDRIFSNY